MRGIGPSRQSCAFDFSKLVLQTRPHAPLVPGGPHSPVHFTLLASLFLLREVEASNALISAWVFDLEEQELTWHLHMSKSDCLALGTKRSWGCLCGLPNMACPFHLALEHFEWLKNSRYFVPGVDPLCFRHVRGELLLNTLSLILSNTLGLVLVILLLVARGCGYLGVTHLE